MVNREAETMEYDGEFCYYNGKYKPGEGDEGGIIGIGRKKSGIERVRFR